MPEIHFRMIRRPPQIQRVQLRHARRRGPREPGVARQFLRERIRRMRLNRDAFRTSRILRPAPEEHFDQTHRESVQPRAVSRELKLIRSVAQDGVAEEVDSLGVHAR
ncbi:MAG: hypothetical protein FD180_4026 [Planctomycetota bacterium]|nr:MAG: hypothetical protein FD180_4026 [Planctomycetota bacterium]